MPPFNFLCMKDLEHSKCSNTKEKHTLVINPQAFEVYICCDFYHAFDIFLLPSNSLL